MSLSGLCKLNLFWLRWVFIAMHKVSLVAVSWGYSLVAVYRLLIAVASLVVALLDSRAQAQ